MGGLRRSIEALIKRWQAEPRQWQVEPVSLLAPQDIAEVRRALAELGKLATEDMVELYSTTGGMAEGEMDSNCFSLWPLERVLREHRMAKSADVQFADFLIDSHRYAFRFVNASHSKLVEAHEFDGSEQVYELYESVAAFFDRYASAADENTAFNVLHGC